MTWRLTSVISGGQTGADRGGLDAAIALDLGWGGWAPKGWRAEDGEIPLIYRERMRCSSSPDYGMRTRLNVQDSDGTLIISFAEELTGGSAYTQKQCHEVQKKPYVHLVLPERGKTRVPDEVAAEVRKWITGSRINILNVAGPRESKEPGIQEAVRDALVWMLEELAGDRHVCSFGFDCQACGARLCWDCEAPLPSGDLEIKTAVRWCKAPDCAMAQAKAYGVT